MIYITGNCEMSCNSAYGFVFQIQQTEVCRAGRTEESSRGLQTYETLEEKEALILFKFWLIKQYMLFYLD